jgi:ribonuclease T2
MVESLRCEMGKRRWLLAVMVGVACGWSAGCKPPVGTPSQGVPSQGAPSQGAREDRSQSTYAESRRDSYEGRGGERRERRGRGDSPQYDDSPQRDGSHQYGDSQRRGGSQRHSRAQADAAPGVFDFYLLTLSWSPEFCLTHAQAAECAAHPGFVLHGLWPQNNDGTYPENCSNEAGPSDPQAYRDILPDLHLLEHEWQTHGTCSGLGPDAYFGEARQAVRSVAVPQDLQHVSSELQLTPQQILGEFAQANPGLSQDNFALSCGNNRLTAVEVCLTKDLKATSCGGVRSCRANVVKVTPPGA